jgi:hypothetical protein
MTKALNAETKWKREVGIMGGNVPHDARQKGSDEREAAEGNSSR